MKASRILVRITGGRGLSEQFCPHFVIARDGSVSQTSDPARPTWGGLKGTGLNASSIFVFLDNAGLCLKSDTDGLYRSVYGQEVPEASVAAGRQDITSRQLEALSVLSAKYGLPIEQSPGDVLSPGLEGVALANSAGPFARCADPSALAPAPYNDSESLLKLLSDLHRHT